MSRGTRLISISTVALGIWASSMIGPVAAQDASKAGGLNNGMKLSSDQPIQIDSDRLDVHNDVGTATFTGNVTVTQGTTLMKAGSMIVYYVKKPEKTDAEKAALAERLDMAPGDQGSRACGCRRPGHRPHRGQ